MRDVLFAIGSYDDEIHRGAADFAREHNWRLRAVTPQTSMMFHYWKGDGILCCPGGRELNEFLLSSTVPKVNITLACIEDGIPIVAEDSAGIARAAATFFERKGFQHFVFVSLGQADAQAEIFESSLQRQPQTCDRWCLNQVPGGGLQVIPWLSKRLTEMKKPLAIFCNFDFQAELVVNACQEAGLQVPGDVSVLGAGNQLMICEQSEITISSVDSNRRYWGYLAAETLERVFRGERVEPLVRVPIYGIVERASTDTLVVEDERLARALHYIKVNISKTMDLDDVARAAGVTRATLTRLFRKKMNSTVNSEVIHCRIEKAKRLLQGGQLNGVAVAAASGFSSPFYFYQVFKKHVGMTVKEYRRRYRHQSLNEWSR